MFYTVEQMGGGKYENRGCPGESSGKIKKGI
jgi:hypothetical protein